MQPTLERLRSEFLEMPGMRLTAPQVQRLCGVDETVCRDVLQALVDSKFLHRAADGTYSRFDDGLQARMAKASWRDAAAVSRAS